MPEMALEQQDKKGFLYEQYTEITYSSYQAINLKNLSSKKHGRIIMIPVIVAIVITELEVFTYLRFLYKLALLLTAKTALFWNLLV